MTHRTFNNLPECIKSQFYKPLTAIYDYLPVRLEATKKQWSVRRFLWQFKDGNHKAAMFAAEIVAAQIIKTFGRESAHMTFVCIPASNAEKNKQRYQAFSARVCELTGMKDGFSAVTVSGEKLALHETKKGEKQVFNTQTVTLKRTALNHKKVVLFDDIITKGMSYARFAAAVENIGAAVVGGFFLAKTIVC